MYKALLVLFALAVPSALSSCSHDTITLGESDDGRTLTVNVGDELDITIGWPGPGKYATPDISSSSIRFLSRTEVGFDPGGSTLLYRFDAAARGAATVTIPFDRDSRHNFGITVTVAP